MRYINPFVGYGFDSISKTHRRPQYSEEDATLGEVVRQKDTNFPCNLSVSVDTDTGNQPRPRRSVGNI